MGVSARAISLADRSQRAIRGSQNDANHPKANRSSNWRAIVSRILKSNLLELTGAVVMFVGSLTEIQAIWNCAHGMSGVLKNSLDWASRPFGRSVLRGKPVLTMTASPAFTGGATGRTRRSKGSLLDADMGSQSNAD
jgi:hypothetical protein